MLGDVMVCIYDYIFVDCKERIIESRKYKVFFRVKVL